MATDSKVRLEEEREAGGRLCRCAQVGHLYLGRLSSLREGGTCTEVCVDTIGINAIAAKFWGEIVK